MRGLLLALLLVGCSDDPPKKYMLYQACYDDKVDVQMKEKIESIVACCLEHEIGGAMPPICGADDAECINYLTANLSGVDADITAKMQACSKYVAEKAK